MGLKGVLLLTFLRPNGPVSTWGVDDNYSSFALSAMLVRLVLWMGYSELAAIMVFESFTLLAMPAKINWLAFVND